MASSERKRANEECRELKRFRPGFERGLAALEARHGCFRHANDFRKLTSGKAQPLGGTNHGLGQDRVAIRSGSKIARVGHGILLSGGNIVHETFI